MASTTTCPVVNQHSISLWWQRLFYTAVLGITILVGSFGQGATTSVNPTSQLPEARVWLGTEGGKATHHVYGLTVSKGGTLLAFSEARIGQRDEDPHDIVCKRSMDGGKTWSADIPIETGDGSFWEANGQPGKKECWTNTAPLADLRTGRVFFFYALNDGAYRGKNTQRMTRVFYKYTDNEGQAWSPRVEITSVLNVKEDGSPFLDESGKPVLNEDGFPCDYLGRAFHMPGPGHGIQLRNGRLLLQFWHRRHIGYFGSDEGYQLLGIAERQYNVSVIYSDDGGKTWRTGGFTGLGQFANESRLVELADGRVMINARIESPRVFRAGVTQKPGAQAINDEHRWVAVSKDGGLTWQQGHQDEALPPYHPTDSGLLRYVPAKKGEKDCLLFSHPTAPNTRAGMTVHVSFDNGATWPKHQLVFAGGSQYSDLVRLPNGDVGLLYGRNLTRAEPGVPFGKFGDMEVVFTRLTYAWLTP